MNETEFRVVIPARFASSRLPGKVLLAIAGKPLLQHVYEQAAASGASEVIIATDDERVAVAAAGFGAEVSMTSTEHRSGTDRVAEVARDRGWGDEMPIVNVQGDAPLIPPASIRQVAALITAHPDADIATLCVPLADEEQYVDVHIVKVVFDESGRALYFSRAPIPAVSHSDEAGHAHDHGWRHLGLYAYRATALQRLSAAEPCALEQVEQLEQLRALWLGMQIRVGVATQAHGPDIDTADDHAEVARLLAAGKAGAD